jgi:hypothetical protein
MDEAADLLPLDEGCLGVDFGAASALVLIVEEQLNVHGKQTGTGSRHSLEVNESSF